MGDYFRFMTEVSGCVFWTLLGVCHYFRFMSWRNAQWSDTNISMGYFVDVIRRVMSD